MENTPGTCRCYITEYRRADQNSWHTSPGRFFAANELKAMLAFIVLNYDLKLANDGPRPENRCFGASVIPDPSADIMIRKRQAA